MVHFVNWFFHWATAVADEHRTMVDFFTVHAAVIPVRVLPAPHGRTMIPDRARPLPSIFDRLRVWCGRCDTVGLRSMGSVGLRTSSRNAYLRGG